MKSFSRSEQVSKQIQRGVSDILQTGLQDPRLDMATITGVSVSSDLRVAYVYYILDGSADSRRNAAAGFKSAAGFVKRELAKRLKMKYMPDIRFRYDESVDYGARIDQILEKL